MYFSGLVLAVFEEMEIADNSVLPVFRFNDCYFQVTQCKYFVSCGISQLLAEYITIFYFPVEGERMCKFR